MGGISLIRRNLIKAVTDKIQSELIVLSSFGYASIIIFRQKYSVFRLTLNKDFDDVSECIDALSTRVKKEIRGIGIAKDYYNTHTSQPRMFVNQPDSDETTSFLKPKTY